MALGKGRPIAEPIGMTTQTSAATDAPKPGAHEATRKQIRGSSLLLGGRFISLGINFAIQIMIVRYLSKADYGAWAYVISLVSLGVSVATFGLIGRSRGSSPSTTRRRRTTSFGARS